MNRGVSRRRRPDVDIDTDFDVDFDSLEDITDTFEALGSGTIEFHPPEFEEPSFGQFIWEEVILLGLFRAEAWPEITVSECEICVGIGLDISLYATAQGKGARVCYRFGECKPEEAENIEEPPPRELLPKPNNLLPTRPAPRFGKSGVLSWCCDSTSTTRLRDENGAVFYNTSSVKCGEWVGEAKRDQEDSTYVSGGARFKTYINESRGTRTYIRQQYWVFVGGSSLSDEEVEEIWRRAQKDGVFVGPANKRNQALVFWISSESYDESGLKALTENAPNLDFNPDYPYTAPPSRSDDNDMNCCKNQRDNDALLKLIYQNLTKVGEEVDKVGVVTGIKDFPVTAPRYLSEDSGGVSLKSIPRFQRYIVEQLDALVGQFPIEIEIEDVDPTQAGNQKEKIKLPNIAESIAEIYGLLTKTAIDGDVSINFLSRLAFELLSVKSATLLTQSYARGNAAYLGYQGNMENFEIQNAFNIDSGSIEKLEDFLKESKVNLKTWVNEDKNTVQGYLERLMFAASIIKEVYVKKDGNETGNKIVDLIAKAALDGAGSRAWEDFMQYLNTEGFVGRKSGTPQPSAEEIKLDE